MDKLMDNPWFIKIIALLLAILLYSSVPHTGSKITDVNVPGEQTTATITDIPVKVYYDTENLVVSGIPNTVDMTIKGPVTHVQSAKALKNFEVYVDLTKAKIGNQTVKLKVKNLSDKLKATIEPGYVNVSIQEKITKEFKVEAEFNSSLLEDGYSAGQPIVEPNKVKITGAKNVIDRITYVKAIVDTKNHLTDTITKEARISVLDRELNKLEVAVDPGIVKVTIPVKSTSKNVPISIVQKGTPPSGVSIDSITLDATDASIIGSEDVLKDTDHVRVEVDVSKISDNTTLTLPVIISNGITKVTPQLVKATVTVKKQGQKSVSGLPLKIRGLSNSYQAQINDPVNQMINLYVNGPNSVVDGLTPNDFNAFIDLTSLAEGNHEVKIQVEGPPDVNWTPDKSTATITISKNA
ncbi:CdaR family protein [Neobacillus ginsengisoli]|uniref:YbbR domain-containing protein n=1 Tax=Neobacillus ginsengisoli TaxID=904295 RepID=A0ABT9Y2F5_9BACI|nr:CdaR family protein [Neobacillus ginsengisoli]MDQ0201997.1 YbbR domain-containing protein [Neobacillus ginsengisoli]